MNSSKALDFGYYDEANFILRRTYNDLLDITPFRMSDLNTLGAQLRGVPVVTTVAARFGKGLWVGERDTAARLSAECIHSVIDQEERLADYGMYRLQYVVSNETRQCLIKAKSLLKAWFRDVRPEEGLKLPPGESFISNRGRVSLFRKFKGEWTTTAAALDSSTTLIVDTLALWRVAKTRIRAKSPTAFHDLDVFIKSCIKDGKIGNEEDKLRMIRKASCMLVKKYCLTVVPGSRLSSVPKDTAKRRPINVEPLCNAILQLKLGAALKRKLATRAKNDLYIGQADHRRLCKDLNKATIDFSGASDSIHMDLVKYLFPKKVVTLISEYRSELVDTGYDARFANGVLSPKDYRETRNWYCKQYGWSESQFDEEYSEGRWRWLHKVSSMGNGFTFEVLTSILLAIARVFDPSARVYGDDVIIAKDKADAFMRVTEDIGFTVNRDKSFTRFGYRESCGVFYHVLYGEILSFEFDQVENQQTLIIAVNKLYHLLEAYAELRNRYPLVDRMFSVIYRCRCDLLTAYPELGKFMGPAQPLIFTRDEYGVEKRRVGEQYVYARECDPRVTGRVRLNPAVELTARQQLKLMGYGLTHVKAFLMLEEVDQLASKTPEVTKDPARIASYLYGGRRVNDIQRVGKNEKVFRAVGALTDGTLVWPINSLADCASCPI